jgi:hypothetical protein
MPTINALDASRHLCPFDGFKTCRGSVCMAWSWHGHAFERAETDNLTRIEDGSERPVGVPPMPDGDGWEADGPSFKRSYHQSNKLGLPPATGQRWMRQVTRATGFCGRIGDRDDGIPF